VIVVDTSALVAIVLGEPSAPACQQMLASEPEVLISAATAIEAMIVAQRKAVAGEMSELIASFDFQTVPVTTDDVNRTANAYRRWGKGFHSAALCFAYALAHERNCSLLFVGNDFAKTVIASAL